MGFVNAYNFRKRGQLPEVNTEIFEIFLGISLRFDFHPRISSYMVRLNLIISDFLEPLNFCTICPCFENFVISG